MLPQFLMAIIMLTMFTLNCSKYPVVIKQNNMYFNSNCDFAKFNSHPLKYRKLSGFDSIFIATFHGKPENFESA